MKRFICGILAAAMLFASADCLAANKAQAAENSVYTMDATSENVNLLQDGGFESGNVNTNGGWKFTGGDYSWYVEGAASVNTETVYEGNNS
ncbi:MAG: hypothetical protein ACI4A5_03880, partial [Hominilimicola sp.]